MLKDGLITEKVRYPSPSPHIDVYMVTYYSSGLKVKGMLAEPKGEGTYEGFL